MKEIEKVLDKNEKIFWEDGPSFAPFVLSKSVITIAFGLLWLIFVGAFMMMATFMSSATGGFGGLFDVVSIMMLLPHLFIGFAILLGPSIYSVLVHKHTYYAITDKRILIQKGVVGRDFEIVDFDKISNAEVNIGLFDKMFGNTGSILLTTAGSLTYSRQGPVSRPYILSNVKNPYEVFKFFKKVSYDVKTDIQFPNKYRPNVNPGYKTKYKPKHEK